MFYFEKDYPPTWVSMEAHSIPIPLNLYLYSADAKKLIKGTKNPYTRNTITVWFEALVHLGELPQLSRFTPVFGNENFRPGRADPGFKIWSIQGISKVSDLYNEEHFMSFEEIRTRFGIPQKHFFKYLQLRSFILSRQGQSLTEPPLSTLENITLNCLKGRGQVSVLYKQFVAKSKESFNDRLQAWRSDL